GLEEDREEALAKLVGDPIVECLRLLVRKRLFVHERKNAHGALDDAEVAERFERFQRIGIILAVVIDAAHARPRNEILRQDLVPEIDDLFGFRKEAVPTYVE